MKYTMYLDESGDANFNKINEDYPILCIAGCVFESQHYSCVFEPKFHQLKRDFFSSEKVILTSRKIRRRAFECEIFQDKNLLYRFYDALGNLLSQSEFIIISTVIFKKPYSKNILSEHENPYHLSIKFIMERFQYFLQQEHGYGEIIPESRGRDQDNELTEKYALLHTNGSEFVRKFDRLKPKCHCKAKAENISGQQIADLSAYPIGSKYLFPCRIHPAYESIRNKFYKNPSTGKVDGCGIKVFPGNYENYQVIEF